jgi:photosystem II stability/assembly factor-like uncharacterized protein
LPDFAKVQLLFALVIAIGCSKRQPVQPPLDKTVIKGVVADSLTGQPLPGATVSLNLSGYITVTDSLGNYSFVGMGGGSFTVNAEKIDWRPNGVAVAVAANDSIELNIKLHPRQWEVVQIPLASPWNYGCLEDLCFINENEGWAVGSDQVMGYPGFIIHTIDGGYTWSMQYGATMMEGNYFHNVDFVDGLNGWAAAGINLIKKTTDGGVTWTDIPCPITTFWAMDFIDNNRGWIIGWANNGSVYKTMDGGNTWSKQVDLPDSTIVSVKFIDANQGWAKSRTKVYATANGDANWFLQQTTAPTGATPYDKIEVLAPGYIWTEGWHSSNGGVSWEYQPSDTFGAVTAISFCNEAYGWMAGNKGSSPDTTFMLHTTDGGKTWSKAWYSTNIDYILGIQFINISSGWAIAHGPMGLGAVALIYK